MKPMLEMQSLESVMGNCPMQVLPMRDAPRFRRLEREGLPSTRHEDWKYTDLTPVIDINNAWAAAGATGS